MGRVPICGCDSDPQTNATTMRKRIQTQRELLPSVTAFLPSQPLLVFNIKLPEQVVAGQLGQMLLAEWPSYAAFVVSFIMVGIFWANHHYMFHYINRSNHLLGMLNVLFLMGISFLPFSTSLVATFVRNPSDQLTAVLVYVGTFLGCALLFNGVWLYATQGHRLVDKNLAPGLIRQITKKYFAGIFAYLVAFALAFWSIAPSLAIVAAVALVFFLPTTPRASRSSAL